MGRERGAPERRVAVEILDAWGNHERLRLWRNNSGVGWFANGRPCRKTDPGALPVRFGTPGQGDYTGLVLVPYQEFGVRLELETKSADGVQSDEQKTFQAMIEKFGGIYVLARSLDDFDDAMALLGITR